MRKGDEKVHGMKLIVTSGCYDHYPIVSFFFFRFLKVALLSQVHLIHKVKLLSKRLCQNTLSNGFLSYFNENIEIFIRIALDLQINFRKIGILTLLNLPL